MSPSVCVVENHEALSRQAAQRILAALGAKPALLLCAAGGSTPARSYQLLADEYTRNPHMFQLLRVVKLDEWGGIDMDDPASCETQLRKQLVSPLSLSADRYFGLNSNSKEPNLECKHMQERLATDGPIDLCVLGLGVNGHIGMNEPAPSLQASTHVERLTDVSLRHTMLAQARTRPTYGLTLGMTDIMVSREILLLVSGSNKREPLQRLMMREITTDFPASFLWLHSNWTLICDRDAADALPLKP